jgi:AraC family transcriptional regulator of adaptative response / DNA-3-methyladenine glycosylase II
VRRFNAAFAERYRMSPSALRRARDGDAPAADTLAVRLGWRPPYDAAGVLAFLGQRAVGGVEAVHGLQWRRTLTLEHRGETLAGWLAATFVPERCEVHATLSRSLTPVIGVVLQRLRQALDLDADPALIDPALSDLPGAAGTRVPNGLDGFEIAARVILGQQVTVAAARTLARRLVERFGAPCETPWPGLDRTFPTARAIAAADPDAIGSLGIVRQRVRALQALAAAVHDGRLALHRAAPLEPTLDALRALPGVGEWTVQLIAMRALAWPDAFPAADIGVQNALALRDATAAATRAEAWRPWRAYAVMRLWQAAPQPKPIPEPA